MNIHNSIMFLHQQLADLNSRLDGHFGRRPWRNPWNQYPYKMWLEIQTEETKKIESTLYMKGHYKYEGEQTMFNVKSKEGQQLHVDDVVKVEDQDCIVMSIISERDVQVNPVGPGLPFITSPENISVVYSFIEKLKGLSTDEELMAVLSRIEGLATEIGTPPPKLVKVKKDVVVSAEPEMDF